MNNQGWVIEWLWSQDDQIWITIIPEENTKYEVHKQAVYPFKSVALDVARYIKRFSDTRLRVVPVTINSKEEGTHDLSNAA